MIRTHKLPFIIFVCLIASTQVESKLDVHNFAQLGPLFEDNDLKDIPYSIANFGFAPYTSNIFRFGKTMVAHLQETPGLDN